MIKTCANGRSIKNFHYDSAFYFDFIFSQPKRDELDSSHDVQHNIFYSFLVSELMANSVNFVLFYIYIFLFI